MGAGGGGGEGLTVSHNVKGTPERDASVHENLMAAVGFKQTGLQIGVKCICSLHFSRESLTRQAIAHKGSGRGKRARSRCFGLNVYNASCS